MQCSLITENAEVSSQSTIHHCSLFLTVSHFGSLVQAVRLVAIIFTCFKLPWRRRENLAYCYSIWLLF